MSVVDLGLFPGQRIELGVTIKTFDNLSCSATMNIDYPVGNEKLENDYWQISLMNAITTIAEKMMEIGFGESATRETIVGMAEMGIEKHKKWQEMRSILTRKGENCESIEF